MLYRGFVPKEGEQVLYLGTHVINWRFEYGEPQIAFVEDDTINDLLDVARMMSSLECADGGRAFPTKEMFAAARAAIAKAEAQ